MSFCTCSAGRSYEWDYHSESCPVYMHGYIKKLEAERDTWKAAAEERERLLVEVQDVIQKVIKE